MTCVPRVGAGGVRIRTMPLRRCAGAVKQGGQSLEGSAGRQRMNTDERIGSADHCISWFRSGPGKKLLSCSSGSSATDSIHGRYSVVTTLLLGVSRSAQVFWAVL